MSIFSLIQDVKRAADAIVSDIQGGISEVTSDVQKFFEPTDKVRIRDLAREAGNLAKNILEPTPLEQRPAIREAGGIPSFLLGIEEAGEATQVTGFPPLIVGGALLGKGAKFLKLIHAISKKLEPLAQEARKFKSAEEFAKALKTSKEFGFAGEKEVFVDLPIKDIRGRLLRMEEFRDIAERGGLPTAGREVKKPIFIRVESLIDLKNTRVDIVDGHQRLRQAIANKQETIPARIFLPENAPQLTDFYNKAVAKAQKTITPELEPLAQKARNMGEAEFISSNIFERSIVGKEKQAIEMF